MLQYFRSLGLALLLSAGVGSHGRTEELGQAYEEVWYGYQRLLSQETTAQNPLFISCGVLAEKKKKKTFEIVWYDFKISKTSGRNLFLSKIIDNKWKLMKTSNIGPKYADFNFRTEAVSIFEIIQKNKLLAGFRAYVPEWEKKTVWKTPLGVTEYKQVEEWNKYFTILNQVDKVERLDLSSGVYFSNYILSETSAQIRALAKPTTISSAIQKTYVTNENFYIDQDEYISCLSLKDF